MPKVTVNLPKPVYNKLCKLAVEGRSIDEIITHASGILIDTIRRATKRELETAHWFTIASAIDMDYRQLFDCIFRPRHRAILISLYKEPQSWK